MKKALTRLAALLIAVVMILGVAACSAADNNPGIGRVGKVSFTLADYMQYYAQYAQYASYFSDLNGTIKTQLINYGVTLNHCYEIGLELDEEEEAELAKTVEDSINESIEGMTVDSSITGEEEIWAAKTAAFVKKLKDSGYRSLDQYRKLLTEDNRKTMLIKKLREQVNAEVEFGPDQVQEYFDENAPKDKEKYENDPAAYSNAYNSFITGQGAMPLYTPAGMFTVKHCLIQYANQSEVSDTVEGTFGDDEEKCISDIRSALERGITLEEFVTNYVSNKDYNDDTVLVPAEVEEGKEPETVDTNPQLGYLEHGYIMNEDLLNKYFDGFGAAACLLYYGEDWTIPVEEDADSTAEPTAEPTTEPEPELPPIEKYDIKFYETTDGHKIAEVKTNVAGGGMHYIYVNEELAEGAATLDINDTESALYQSIAKTYRATLESNHYQEVFEGWKANTKIALNDRFIDRYARDYLGIK